MKLSDYKDEKAIEVIADLLVPIGNIALNKDKIEKTGTTAHFVSQLMKLNPKEVMAMIAILNGVDPEEYHCNAASVLKDALEMFSDPELMLLFGSQSETKTSSGSVSESIEVEEQ